MLYVAQIETSPPRFRSRSTPATHDAATTRYFFENRLRERYGLEGVPVIIDLVERKDRHDAQ